MRKANTFASLLVGGLCIATPMSAGGWTPPSNVRIVQQTDAGTKNVYPSIQDALTSIPANGANAPSATNPYLVKVMPGTYDLGTGTLTLPPYVSVEGSGPDSTVITSVNANVDDTCPVGTIVMASNSSISKLKVVNPAPQQPNSGVVAALVFNGVQASAQDVSIVAGNDGAVGGFNAGVCIQGASSVRLSNVTIEAHNGTNGYSDALRLSPGAAGSLTVTNSRLRSYIGAIDGQRCVLLHSDNTVYQCSVVIADSTLEANCPNPFVMWTGSNPVSVLDSTIIVNGQSGNYNQPRIGAGGDFTMIGSRIVSNLPLLYDLGGSARIATSQLAAPSSATDLSGVKLVNDFDDQFAPIPNQ